MKYVFDLRAPPPVDRLIVVTHGKQVTVHGCEHFNNFVLHGVRVLELVHENVSKTPRQIFPRFFVGFKQTAGFVQQIVEIERVVFAQMLLITGIHFRHFFYIAIPCVFFGVTLGGKTEHFRVGDMEFHRFEQFFVVEITFLKGFFDDVIALGFAINGKVFLNTRFLRKHTQNAHAHTMNRTNPRTGNIGNAEKPLLHLISGFVRERDGEYGFARHPFFF